MTKAKRTHLRKIELVTLAFSPLCMCIFCFSYFYTYIPLFLLEKKVFLKMTEIAEVKKEKSAKLLSSSGCITGQSDKLKSFSSGSTLSPWSWAAAGVGLVAFAFTLEACVPCVAASVEGVFPDPVCL